MNKKYKVLKAWADKAAGDIVEMKADDAAPLVEAGILELAEDGDSNDNPFEKAVDDALSKFQEGLVKTVEATTKSIAGKLATGDDGKTPADVTDVHDRVEDDPKLGFKSVEDFARCVKTASDPDRKADVDDRLRKVAEVQSKAPYGNNESAGAEGGWLVPPEFSNRILERAADELPIISKCDQIVLSGNSITINGAVDDDRSDSTHRYGGIVVYWVGEAAQITRSNLKFRQVSLRLHKMAAMAFVTDEELEDANVNLGSRLTGKAGEAMRDELVEAIMFGDGAGKPLGAFASDAVVGTSKETDQAADSIVAENVAKMYSNIWASSVGKGDWYYNNECLPQLETMSLSVGTGGQPVFIPAGGWAQKPQSTLKGRPAFMTEHCEALGDAGDIVFGDFSQYLLATKGSIKTAVSIHLRFDYDETAFRFTWRCDGRPAWDKTMKPRKGASAKRVAPFVKLNARA